MLRRFRQSFLGSNSIRVVPVAFTTHAYQTSSSATSSSSSSSSPTKKQQEPEERKLHVYTTFDTADGHTQGLVDHMSDIQRDEYTRRHAVKLNIGQDMPDPIWYENHHNETYSRSKGEMEHFMPKETQAHWMRVVDAARLLQIAKAEVPGITIEKIESKFAIVYANAKTNAERDLLTSAAETMLEYIKSSFAADITKARKLQVLAEMKRDLDQETRAWHHKVSESLIYGVSGYVTGAMTLTAMAIIGFYFYNGAGHMWSQENNLTAESMGRMVRKAVNYDPNFEGTPDYTDRYKNTPTSWDMQKAEGHQEIADPVMRKAMQDKDSLTRKELTVMAYLMRDADDIEKKAAEVAERGEERAKEDAERGGGVGPRLLKEMMERKVDAEWWSKWQQFQQLYRQGKENFVSKW